MTVGLVAIMRRDTLLYTIIFSYSQSSENLQISRTDHRESCLKMLTKKVVLSNVIQLISRIS